jgi:hypothetical protein
MRWNLLDPCKREAGIRVLARRAKRIRTKTEDCARRPICTEGCVAAKRCDGVTGMYNEQEVKVQTRGPDRGNPTSKRQGPCCGTPRLEGRDANARRPAKGGLKEVIDACRNRTQVKRRKAVSADEPAVSGEVQNLSEPQAVLATRSTRSPLYLPSEICRAPRAW